ncbi:MAG: PAS domain-containing sensor histidine kinase [Chloroflexota bacterium]
MTDQNASALRQRAEQRFQEQLVNMADFSLEDAKRLIYELHIHQIELELQNEELRVTQLALETSRGKYSDLYEFSPVGLLTLDTHERIQDANLTFVTLLGVDREKILKCHLSDFIDSSTQDAYHFFYQALLSTQQPQQCEIVLISPSRSPLVTRLDGIGLRQEITAGTETTYRIAVSDVTLQKQAETQRVELAAERQRSKVLADFVRDISHDLRTPLALVATGLYLIGKTVDKDKQMEKIEAVNKQLFYLTRVLDQLQQMAVLDSTTELVLQPGSINRQVIEVLNKVKLQADLKPVKLIEQLQVGLPDIDLDADKIGQVLTILLDNALQFTEQGDVITVMTYLENSSIGVEVSDNGAGIDADKLPHIFDRFFKADESRHNATGAGLGLPMAMRIVELHHGSIQVSSVPKVKTAFTVKLPLLQNSI